MNAICNHVLKEAILGNEYFHFFDTLSAFF